MAEPIRWQDRWWHQQPDGSWLLFNEQTQIWEPYTVQYGPPIYVRSTGLSTGAKWGIGIGIAAAVLLILMILAAIAIPVFLRQREKGSINQVESVLRNAAVAQESYCVIHLDTCYTDSVADLETEGLEIPTDVSLNVVTATPDRYCMEATHELLLGRTWSYSNNSVQPREGPCL